MALPPLTIAVITYKRPWYCLLTLDNLQNNLQYEGEKHFIVIDGGSPDWHIQMYHESLVYSPHTIISVPTSSMNQMVNTVADNSGEVVLWTLDDFMLERTMNVTHDVEFLLAQEDVGHLRYARLAFWDLEYGKIYAELRNCFNFHYWVLDKARCINQSYMWTMGFGLTHRRMWDAYFPLPADKPHQPGETELYMNENFRERQGPTIAVPMRLGEESDMTVPLRDPIRHIGYVRTDEYANQYKHSRWGST